MLLGSMSSLRPGSHSVSKTPTRAIFTNSWGQPHLWDNPPLWGWPEGSVERAHQREHFCPRRHRVVGALEVVVTIGRQVVHRHWPPRLDPHAMCGHNPCGIRKPQRAHAGASSVPLLHAGGPAPWMGAQEVHTGADLPEVSIAIGHQVHLSPRTSTTVHASHHRLSVDNSAFAGHGCQQR